MLTRPPLRALLVDDEPLARARLRQLLGQIQDPVVEVSAEAPTATVALEWLAQHPCELLFLDIEMPGNSGLTLAENIRRALAKPPHIVFVTAHARYAVDAFTVHATDYLTKPVRLERLTDAVRRVESLLPERPATPISTPDDAAALTVVDRGRITRLPLTEVVYVRAEQKYLTVRTANGQFTLDGTLIELEEKHPDVFLRVHRNALVAGHAIRELARTKGDDKGDGKSSEPPDAATALPPGEAPRGDGEPEAGGENWSVRVAPTQEWLPVSRRQLPRLRAALLGRSPAGSQPPTP